MTAPPVDRMAPRMAERVIKDVSTAPDGQTVALPGADAAAPSCRARPARCPPSSTSANSSPPGSRNCRRTPLPPRSRPPCRGSASRPGPGSSSTSATPAVPLRCPPRCPRRPRPGNPESALLEPRRTTLQRRQQAARTGLPPSPHPPPSPTRHPGPATTRRPPRAHTTPKPCSASPDAEPTCPSRCSATTPSTDPGPSTQPGSPRLRIPTNRTVVLVLRLHGDRVTAEDTRAHRSFDGHTDNRLIFHAGQTARRSPGCRPAT